MSNNVGPGLLSPYLWSARVQYLLKKHLVGAIISNTEEQATLKFGSQVHRPSPPDVHVQPYVKGTGTTAQDLTATDEYLDVNQSFDVDIMLDDIDKIQNKFDTLNLVIERSAYKLAAKVDQTVFNNMVPALYNSATTAESVGVSNIASLISNAKAALSNNGVEEDKKWFWVMDPDTMSVAEQFRQYNGFNVKDDTLKNGYGWQNYVGDWLGLSIYKSQNLPFTNSLTFGGVGVDGETVTINGVVFTLLDTVGTTQGNVHIGASAAETATNLYETILGSVNSTTVTSANGVGFARGSASARKLIDAGIVPTNPSSGVVTLTSNGKMILAEGVTATTWGTQTKKNFIGQMGCVDLVMQKQVTTEMARMIPVGIVGTRAITSALWGTKQFAEGAQRSYTLLLNA